MKCGICKGDMQEQSVTYTEDIGEGVVIIRHVPATVCSECGNVWYSGKVAAQLESMVDAFSKGQGLDVAIETYPAVVPPIRSAPTNRALKSIIRQPVSA
jgi:YgiT-type zinc finger domain-containing protein